jgi:predicted alpha-1,2-mannosidase
MMCGNRLLLVSFTLLLCGVACTPRASKEVKSPKAESTNWVDYVNPFIGTGGHGHTYPGATMPFGLVQLSPDTRLSGWDGCSGYHDSDTLLYGFSHTHLSGTGVSDYGDILFMPDTGATWHSLDDFAAVFSKMEEEASPGYYKVKLKDRPITAELTATARTGVQRYTYPADAVPLILLDLRHRDPVLKSDFAMVGDRRVEGYRISSAWAKEQHVYFVAEFSRPFTGYFTHGDNQEMETDGKGMAVQLRFAPSKEPLTIRVGISGTDLEGAKKNLEIESNRLAFQEVKLIAREAWEKQLGKVRVKGGTLQQRTIFYTALYHTMIVPNVWSDVDGRYRGMDGSIHQLPEGDSQYTVFSLWDTFRATHPLYTLIEQDRTRAFIRTFLRQYKESGLLPVWELAANETNCMIGYHSVSVIADAYLKNLGGFDSTLALEAMRHSANQTHLGLEAYQRQGFIGAEDESESVSKALEYAYDDWTIAQMARKMGRNDLAEEFEARALHYRNHFDPETKFFRARRNGGWMAGFDPREVNFNFTEANAWQYSLFVPQDIGGLIDLHGGNRAFERHLDSLFGTNSNTTGREQADITGLIGQYAHGNEPSHHMAYLYTYCQAPHKAQKWVRHIMDNLYHNAPDGLSGNEDCGQMSAWLVMSAMGLYAVAPGSPHYTLGSPWFQEVEINLENGNSFTISAPGNNNETPFVQHVRLNGEQYPRPWISHKDIMKGGQLEFVMGIQPKPDCFSIFDFPDFRIHSPNTVSAPYVVAASETFSDSMTLQFHAVDKSHQVVYRANGGSWVPAIGGLTIDQSTQIEFKAMDGKGNESKPVSAAFYKINQARSVVLGASFANQYAAGGSKAVIDQLRGGTNFRTGRWQGYPSDFHATVDLGSIQDIRYVGLGCLQDIGSWIWMPKAVRVSFSDDGLDFTEPLEVPTTRSDRDYQASTEEIHVQLEAIQRARYVKVHALNYGRCPEWHLGSGGQAWIFVDEIVVK